MNAPDLIVHNGKITTLDPAQSQVSAVAISGGRISATGGGELLAGINGTAVMNTVVAALRQTPGLTTAELTVDPTPPVIYADVPSGFRVHVAGARPDFEAAANAAARSSHIPLHVDAEESDRCLIRVDWTALTLQIAERLKRHPHVTEAVPNSLAGTFGG